MLSLNEILLLAVIYCFAYGFGVFLSKLWWWLRIVIFIVFCRGLAFQFNDFKTVNLAVFLAVIVPMFILALPSLKQLSAPRFRFSLNPFRWIREKISMRRYNKWQRQEQAQEQARVRKEGSEDIERVARLQAERQRQFEREKAEWEAKKKAEEDALRRRKEESQSKAGQEQAPQKSASSAKKSPYEVLGVSSDASIEVIKKAYTELSKKYHPDRVSHLGVEFQEIAHEKYIEIKEAWEKIKSKRDI